MALVGLKNLYIAKMTDEATEAYAIPEKLAKAIEAGITPNVSSNTLYADDGPAETDTTLGEIEVTIGVDQLSNAMLQKITGATVDTNGVVIQTSDDSAPYFALGFESKKSNGQTRFVWLYKGKFQIPEDSFQTKGESIEFNTPSITGTFIKRTKDNAWRAIVDSDDPNIAAGVASGWYDKVYEKDQV